MKTRSFRRLLIPRLLMRWRYLSSSLAETKKAHPNTPFWFGLKSTRGLGRILGSPAKSIKLVFDDPKIDLVKREV